MALTINNKTASIATPSSTTSSFSHTTTAGSNVHMYLTITMSNATTVAGVTYNGVAMTLHEPASLTTTSTTYIYLYRLANPSTGSNTVLITYAAGQYNPVSCEAVSASDANGVGNTSFDDTAGSPNSTSITVSANSVIFGLEVAGNNSAHVITLDGSSRTLEYTHAINNYTSGAFSASGLTAGSKTVSVAAGANLAGYYYEIKELAAAPTSTQGMMLMFM